MIQQGKIEEMARTAYFTNDPLGDDLKQSRIDAGVDVVKARLLWLAATTDMRAKRRLELEQAEEWHSLMVERESSRLCIE